MAKTHMIHRTEKEVVERDVQVPYVHLELSKLEVATLRQIFTLIGGTPEGLRGVVDGIGKALRTIQPDWRPAWYDYERRDKGMPAVVEAYAPGTGPGLFFTDDSKDIFQAELDDVNSRTGYWL